MKLFPFATIPAAKWLATPGRRPANDAAVYRDVALQIAGALDGDLCNETNAAASASSCRAEHARDDTEVRPLLRCMSAACPSSSDASLNVAEPEPTPSPNGGSVDRLPRARTNCAACDVVTTVIPWPATCSRTSDRLGGCRCVR